MGKSIEKVDNMQSPSVSHTSETAGTPGTSSDSCHHPGYHSLSARSWWCDGCLAACHKLEDTRDASQAQWSDFFNWLGGLLVTGAATVVSGLFAVLCYLIGSLDQDWGPANELDNIAKWQRQLDWLLVRRQRLLAGIDRCRADQSKAYFDRSHHMPSDLQMSIDNLEQDLLVTMIKIEALEEKLSVRREPEQPDYYVMTQQAP